MSFQIREVVLYSLDGQRRRLPFHTGGVSIITGRSGTGKSALIPILDYCLGRSTFTVPEGAIRDAVSWYGVLIQVEDGTQVFIAKPAPGPSAASQSRGLLLLGADLEPPGYDELEVNTNDDAIEETLSRLLGMSPNLHTPPEGQTRDPLSANISHTKFYLFQEQGVVANRDILFFRQAEPFLPQAMKDTLPYLLGAVHEDRLAHMSELRQLRREARMLERDIAERKAIAGGGTTTGRALLAEAAEVGLVETLPAAKTVLELRRALADLDDWVPAALPESGGNRAPEVRDEIDQIRAQLRDLAESIQAAKAYSRYASSFEEEVAHQRTRLQSIEILPAGIDEPQCPFCGHVPEDPPPKVEALRTRLAAVGSQLEAVQHHRPRLVQYLDELGDQRISLRQLLKEKQQELAAIEAEDARSEALQDQNSRIAKVLGRISLYLESEPEREDVAEQQRQLESMRARILRLERILAEDAELDILRSFLNRIGADMTRLAARLPFEHSQYPLRFDERNLTVVADRPQRPFPMQRMGSAQNWLVCHVVALLALHRHFRTEARPVPGFLVLDQPTQVYFPSSAAYQDVDGTVQKTSAAGADLEAVSRLFKLLFDVVDELDGSLQIIVLEHANLQDARYQGALLEAPWDGLEHALVPPKWLDGDVS